ncbi:hypothetical protein [Sedimenticola hydrogenitrophicus]|uniref:hypothetical protein n=1 Tax=Sedimenticola hydrogenitrophicus TaxID=2967975 RepID=UPI0021A3EC85|nr:hypothetical protein [Sedimenticola hydrogenitrophicus]
MEFFRRFSADADETRVRQLITLARLPQLCASIDALLEDQGDWGRIYCVWGEFRVRREPIRNGVRLTLPGCPNALAWTVTAEQQSVTIHRTINRADHDADFVASIEQFVEDWQRGLSQAFQGQTGSL